MPRFPVRVKSVNVANEKIIQLYGVQYHVPFPPKYHLQLNQRGICPSPTKNLFIVTLLVNLKLLSMLPLQSQGPISLVKHQNIPSRLW